MLRVKYYELHSFLVGCLWGEVHTLKWFVFFTFIVSMTLSLIGLAVDVVFHTSYVPAIEKWQDKKSNNLEHYLREKEFFAGHRIFSTSDRERQPDKDFADFLHSRIAPGKDFLFIPLEQQSEVLALRNKWMDKKFTLEAPQAVRETFNRALDYDYWNIEKTLEAKPNIAAREFIVAGQLILASSLKDETEKSIETLKKVRHFARLLLSCENLNFKLAGLSLLSKEQDFISYIDLRMPAQQVEWVTIPLSNLKRYRDFLYTTYDYFDFLMPPALLGKIFIHDKLPSGFCSVFHKKAPILSRAAPLLKGFFPFEPDFSQEYSAYLEINEKAQQKCQSSATKTSQPLSLMTSKIPFYRRIKALKFLLNNKSLSEGS